MAGGWPPSLPFYLVFGSFVSLVSARSLFSGQPLAWPFVVLVLFNAMGFAQLFKKKRKSSDLQLHINEWGVLAFSHNSRLLN